MAWHTNMMTPLRVLINDLESGSYTYSDETLQKLLVTSAAQVIQEVKIEDSELYTLDYDTPSISPDPSSDSVFTNFIVMKAACLKNQWDFSAQAVSSGVRARCGPVSMEKDSSSASVLTALLNQGFCAAYQEMRKQHNFGNIKNIRSVLTPFSHSQYYPTYSSTHPRSNPAI